MNNDKSDTMNRTANKMAVDGKVSEKKPSLRDKVGSTIERVGHKISNAGAPAVGQKIHDLGDKIEESHKSPNHPHNV